MVSASNNSAYIQQYIRQQSRNRQAAELKHNQKEISANFAIAGALAAGTGIAHLGYKSYKPQNVLELVNKVCNHMKNTSILKDNDFSYFFVNDDTKISNNGKNIFKSSMYIPDLNSALVKKTNCLDMPHEIGHAILHNGKFGPAVRALKKYLPAIGIGIPLIATLATMKSNGDSKDQKITDIIKNNAGKIAFVGFLPVLADEAYASFKGIISTKKISPDILKPVIKTYLMAGMTYCLPILSGCMILNAFPKVIQYFKDRKSLTSQ